MWRNSSAGYGRVSKTLHWLMFVLISALLISGLIAEDLGDALEDKVMALHMAGGFTVLALVMVRVLWRLSNATPAPAINVAVWERRLAQLTHLALYGLMFVQPLTGLLMTQYEGSSIDVFGLFTVPLFVGKDKSMGHRFSELHEFGWYVLAAVVTLHVLAALYHHFVRKDDVLRRMTIN
jgi:cytochrome b561